MGGGDVRNVAEQVTEVAEPRGSATGETVVLAEDSEIAARLIQHSLEHAGYNVVRVANGDLALQATADHHPSVVVLDINMPGRDGLEVLRMLRRDPTTMGLRILMLTGLKQPGIRARAAREGADDYLTKPFAPDELVTRVRRLLGSA